VDDPNAAAWQAPRVPIDADAVRRILESTGFPLELQVAREFANPRGPYGVAAEVRHASYYQDPVEGKAREIDVVAAYGSAITQATPVRYEIVFAVECKSGTDGAWVLFTGDVYAPHGLGLGNRPHHSEHFPWVTIAGTAGMTDSWGRQGIEQSPIVATSGRSLSSGDERGKNKNVDQMYEALTGAVAAADALTADARTPRIVFPVVVTDLPLFSCSMAPTGPDISVEKIESGQAPLLWRRPSGERDATIVDVVTLDALPGYVEQAHGMASELLRKTEAEKTLIDRLKAARRAASDPSQGVT